MAICLFSNTKNTVTLVLCEGIIIIELLPLQGVDWRGRPDVQCMIEIKYGKQKIGRRHVVNQPIRRAHFLTPLQLVSTVGHGTLRFSLPWTVWWCSWLWFELFIIVTLVFTYLFSVICVCGYLSGYTFIYGQNR